MKIFSHQVTSAFNLTHVLMAVISQLSAARSVYSAAQENMTSLVHVYDKLKDLSGCLFLQTTDDKNKKWFLCWIRGFGFHIPTCCHLGGYTSQS